VASSTPSEKKKTPARSSKAKPSGKIPNKCRGEGKGARPEKRSDKKTSREPVGRRDGVVEGQAPPINMGFEAGGVIKNKPVSERERKKGTSSRRGMVSA